MTRISSIFASALCLGAFCNDVVIYDHQTITVLPQVPEVRINPRTYDIPEALPLPGQVQGVIRESGPTPPPPVNVIVLQPRQLGFDQYMGLADKWKKEAEEWKRKHPQD